MKRIFALCAMLLLSCSIAAAISAVADAPARDILGIRLDMSKTAAHARLQKLGRLEREERKRQEVWLITDKRFSHILLGYDTAGKVRYVTAVAREKEQPVRYADVADLKKARQMGDPKVNNFIFMWELEARGDAPKTQVIAQGRDPQHLHHLSLKRVQ